MGCNVTPGERLHDFNVGISNVSPLVTTPSPGGYSMCNHFTGAAGAEERITCDNNESGRHIGRYVNIQIVTSPGNSDYLTLCEVSIYAGKIRTNKLLTYQVGS